jgi:hypothetical protein
VTGSTARQPSMRRATLTGARRMAAVATVVAVVAAVAAVAVVANVFSGDGDATATATAATSAAPGNSHACDEVATRDNCKELSVGGRVWRYSLSRAATETRRTVIADFGGPGLTVLVNGYLTRFLGDYGQALSAFNILTVEEPWVLQEQTPACRSALTNRYLAARTLRSEVRTKTGELKLGCAVGARPVPQWGFSEKSYQDLMAALGAHEDLQYVGFVGQSFGSVRLKYLTSMNPRQSLEWAALSNPFPVGVSANELISARAYAITKRFAVLTDGNGSLSPLASSNRSLPVSEFDALSAKVELGYLGAEEQAQAARDIASGTRPAVVARLSDRLWQRYGSDQIAPSYLAQMDEVCSAMTTGRPQTETGLEKVLWQTLAPCLDSLATKHTKLSLGKARTCVAVSPNDTVTPKELSAKVFHGSAENLRWETQEAGGHRSADGLRNCLSWAIGRD